MSSPLDNLTGPSGDLIGEPPDRAEFDGLCGSAKSRLIDAANISLSLESRFVLAYGAAHAFCLAALRAHGFRPKKRYIVFQVLPHTLGLGPEVWRILSKAHETRNLGEYEGDLNIDERFVTDLVTAVQAVAAAIIKLPPP